MDNYGGSADQLVIMQIVTYNWPAKLGSDTKRGVSCVSCVDLWSTMEANDYDLDKRETKVVGIYWNFYWDYFYYLSI